MVIRRVVRRWSSADTYRADGLTERRDKERKNFAKIYGRFYARRAARRWDFAGEKETTRRGRTANETTASLLYRIHIDTHKRARECIHAVVRYSIIINTYYVTK